MSFVFMRWGAGLAGQEVADVVRDHPIVLDKLGGIDECTLNFVATAEEAGEDTLVYDVKGPKGSGRLVVLDVEDVILAVTLRIGSEEFELVDDDDGDVQGPPIVPGEAPR